MSRRASGNGPGHEQERESGPDHEIGREHGPGNGPEAGRPADSGVTAGPDAAAEPGVAAGPDAAAGPGVTAGPEATAESGVTAEREVLSDLSDLGDLSDPRDLRDLRDLRKVRDLRGLFGPGPDGDPEAENGGADLDEVALRRMLHGAVKDLKPVDGTLDHLKRAVPARRAKRRQAVVGMAAAALLIGTAVPALVHVANSDGANAANPAIAGHGEQAQGGNGADDGAGSDGRHTNGSTDGQGDGDPDRPASSSDPADNGGPDGDGGASGGAADPSGPLADSLPNCDPGQLGVLSAETGAAGADGTVYGTFRISNVSGTECSVSTGGSVGFQAIGAADPNRIAVVQHTAGDAASGLPDPSQEQRAVLLKPSMSYEVKFAWVPKESCPATGSSPSPTPTEDAGGASGAAAGAGGGDGNSASAQLGSEDGGGSGTQDGSVAVTHTPEAGAPVAQAKIPNACSGTIYRTGVLAPAS
ncbi:hypothetical protein ACFVWY_00065 [Streptomyces sp. NPDC058195]|uniref:hypothetical protein n=1 Tax=Streptomyces sp. NPDC058195 TaxID=3346375 RepID=UPI0036EF7D8F